MTGGSFGERLRAARAEAFEEAARVLQEFGFARIRERRWAGRIGSAQHRIEVEIPEGFPDMLPAVYMGDEPERPRIAHVEEGRKVCLALPSGTLVDAARVCDVIKESLARAEAILNEEAGHQVAEIEREFLGYWNGENHGVVNICPPESATGEAWLVPFRGDGQRLLACDTRQANDWLEATGHRAGLSRPAWLVRLGSSVPLPKPGRKLRFAEVLSFLERELPAPDFAATTAWLLKHGFPAFMAFSSPVAGGGGRAIYALWVPKPEVDGFRDMVPNEVCLRAARGQPVVRVSVDRADPEFLLPRGGAVAPLRSRTVLVAGCGSVGSHLAIALGGMGVGRLILVDPEKLGTENVHRHVLGAAQVGEEKVAGLRTVLRQRFPHLAVETRAEAVEEVLASDEGILDQVDLVVLALGDETLERRLNTLLKGKVRLVHVWLEPHGVGGHVLVAGSPGSIGCFCCLFRQDEEQGLVNEATLVEPNQKFQRSIGGCAGTFTPFGILDAQRVALEAAREVGTVLKVEAGTGPRLSTWAGSKGDLIAAGFRVSKRGESMEDGAVTRITDIAKPDCHVCGGGTA